MKIKELDFDAVLQEVKFGDLPKQEQDVKIEIANLKKKLPFTWADVGLNREIGLINYNRFIIIAGEGASGKTTYTMQQAIDNANNGHKVAYMSIEMGRANLITNIARSKAGIEKQKEFGKDVYISKTQEEIFNKQVEKLQNNLNLDIIGYEDTFDTETFRNELNRLASLYDMVFIDNLGMIDRAKKESEVLPLLTEIILKARQKHKVTIVALHHMSKGTEYQKGPRGKNAIRGSGKLLDDADIIMTISRDEIGNSFTIVKDRDFGLLKEFRMMFAQGEFHADLF